MRKATIVAITALALVFAVGSAALAAPTTNTSSSYGVEGAFGIQDGDTWLSVYSLAYDVLEDGETSKVLAPTVFVDGPDRSLECWAFTDTGIVSVDPSLSGGSYSGTVEGWCFDYISEESVPFTITLDVEAVGTGVTQIRGGSYVDDGNRCVSQRRSRDATATGEITIQIPDRGIDATASVEDSFTSLSGFSSRCYPMNGQMPGDDH